jgi:hypothetical protein
MHLCRTCCLQDVNALTSTGSNHLTIKPEARKQGSKRRRTADAEIVADANCSSSGPGEAAKRRHISKAQVHPYEIPSVEDGDVGGLLPSIVNLPRRKLSSTSRRKAVDIKRKKRDEESSGAVETRLRQAVDKLASISQKFWKKRFIHKLRLLAIKTHVEPESRTPISGSRNDGHVM